MESSSALILLLVIPAGPSEVERDGMGGGGGVVWVPYPSHLGEIISPCIPYIFGKNIEKIETLKVNFGISEVERRISNF